MKIYWVYILCSRRNGSLYIGITNNLGRRIDEHKRKIIDGFTKKHAINTLVHAELFHSIEEAICREKCLKRWNRSWKLELIELNTPQWKALSNELF
jgi:putative endonuclease